MQPPTPPGWFTELWRNSSIKVQGAYRKVREQRHRYRHGRRDCYVLCSAQHQERHIQQGSQVLTLHHGQAALLPPGYAFEDSTGKRGKDACTYFMDFFTLLDDHHADPLAYLPRPVVIDLPQADRHLARFAELCSYFNNWHIKEDASILLARPLADALLADLVLAVFANDTSPAQQVPAWLWSLRSFLREAFKQRDLNLDDMARHAGYSRSRVSHAFREHFGTTPMAFVQQERLRLARRLLLEQGDRSVTAIAHVCGFRSVSQFCRCFANSHGLAPGQWRAQQQAAR